MKPVEWYQIASAKATKGPAWHVSLPESSNGSACFIGDPPIAAVQRSAAVPFKACHKCAKHFVAYSRRAS